MRHYVLKPRGPVARPLEKAVTPPPCRPVPRALTGPLSNEQKARICILARQGHVLAFTDQDLHEWRRDQQLAACGKESLTECSQDDYLMLKSHFQKLAGEEGDSQRTANRHETEPARVAMHKLREALASRGLAIGYAISICRVQYKCTLEEASAKQLWCLVYTVRNRRKAAQ